MVIWLITALIGLPLTAAIAIGYHYRRARYPAPVPIDVRDRESGIASVMRYGSIERRARNRSALTCIGGTVIAGGALLLAMAATGDSLEPAGALTLLGILVVCSALLSLIANEAARTLFVYFGQRAHPSDAFFAPCLWCSCRGTVEVRSRYSPTRIVTCTVCAGQGWSTLRAIDWGATETWLTFAALWTCVGLAFGVAIGGLTLVANALADGNALSLGWMGIAFSAMFYASLFALWRIASSIITAWGRRFLGRR